MQTCAASEGLDLLMPRDFVVGLGSNLGDRPSFLRRGVDRLAASPGLELRALSHVYETPPVGPPQPDYLNAAVRLSAERALEANPEQLLDRLLEIERGLGRTRELRWGPRVLDLDLLWSSERFDSERLHIPHAHLRERSFALAPLLDVAPELDAEYAALLSGLGGRPRLVGHLSFDSARGHCEYIATEV
jgi:2-amino-4-hydroxy-6-hydroxymethyldihydropteridine diphosphokinase